jgi:hypothetical protein
MNCSNRECRFNGAGGHRTRAPTRLFLGLCDAKVGSVPPVVPQPPRHNSRPCSCDLSSLASASERSPVRGGDQLAPRTDGGTPRTRALVGGHEDPTSGVPATRFGPRLRQPSAPLQRAFQLRETLLRPGYRTRNTRKRHWRSSEASRWRRSNRQSGPRARTRRQARAGSRLRSCLRVRSLIRTSLPAERLSTSPMPIEISGIGFSISCTARQVWYRTELRSIQFSHSISSLSRVPCLRRSSSPADESSF